MLIDSTSYIRTSEIPALLLRERAVRFSHSTVRAWIARPADAFPLVPTRHGRPGQSHEHDPADVLVWYDAEHIRTLTRRIKVKLGRMRSLGIRAPLGGEWV